MKVKHTITVEQELIKDVKILAIKAGKSYGEVIEEALRQYLEREELK